MTAPSMAEVLCSADDTMPHHDRTDDYPCTHCKGLAQALAAAGFGHVASVEAERDKFVAAFSEQFDQREEYAAECKRLWPTEERLEAAEAQVAAVRALADEWSTTDGPVDGSYRTGEHSYSYGRLLRAALDGEGGR